jgi:hypothetical protein
VTEPDVIYRGHPNTNPAGPRLVTIETPDGQVLGQLRHVVKHSPTGYSWGYGGSGPADLARSLLIDALGPDVRCTACGGSGRMVYDEDADSDVPYDPERHDPELAFPCGCEGGLRTDLLRYQEFKWAFVAGWSDTRGWSITRSQIREWYEQTRSEVQQ